MKYFKIRNWSRFQHYSNRAPVWIKLYTNMIDDEVGDWARWTDIQRGHIVGIWQLAAKTGNCMPFDNDIIFEEIMATEPISLESFGKHLDVYPSKRDCLASNPASMKGTTSHASDSARLSMVRCSSPSSSISSSSESESEDLSTKKYNFAVDLLRTHSRPVPSSMTATQANSIINELKNAKPATGPRVPVNFPDDPDLTDEERKASDKALAKLLEREGPA